MYLGVVNVYAPNLLSEKKDFFVNLNEVIGNLGVPMIVGGDFNSVRESNERIGISVNSCDMGPLNEFIQAWNLVDLPFSGSCFTWFEGGSSTSANRLDRFLISTDVLCKIPSLIQKTLKRSLSDHNTVVLQEITIPSRPRPFKWLCHWAEDSGFRILVEEIVGRSQNIEISKLLSEIKMASKTWAKVIRDAEKDSIKVIESKISDLEQEALVGNNNSDVLKEIQIWKVKLWSKYRREEREWLQKSRLKWFIKHCSRQSLKQTEYQKIYFIKRVLYIT
ncbi:uncharacterized protein LOC120158513 [Hibiscus syriacus]|uniref:uncharacterized protein LOC120158513 n=1 Tax=Hibiscus syriacus TaxID=106335 RepID=UPI001921BE9A|nr:uncharacterized protein LOC120158513 [Hibiscus syriacus]